MGTAVIEIDECTSISLVAEDGCEVTITMRRDMRGEFVVSLYMDDGHNITQLQLPRKAFDALMSEMGTLQ